VMIYWFATFIFNFSNKRWFHLTIDHFILI
jgi:hypothetical protein